MWNDFGFWANPYAGHPIEGSEMGERLLVGRDAELQRLSQGVKDLSTHPTVEGPNGIGKTSLIAVTTHLLGARTAPPRYFDLGRGFQITEQMSARQFENEVIYAAAQALVTSAGALANAGLTTADTTSLAQWLNQPVFRGVGVTTPIGGASYAATPSESSGFSQEGLRNLVLHLLEVAFPSPSNGAFLCVIDNVEVLGASTQAADMLGQLRDTAFAWPGLVWILSGSSGVLRAATSMPRLQGRLGQPIEVDVLADSDVPTVIERRVQEFRIGPETYVPVEPDGFADLYGLVAGDLRAAVDLCQNYASSILNQTWPEGGDKRLSLSAYLDSLSAEYLAGTDQLDVPDWSLFDDLVGLGGMCRSSDHRLLGVAGPARLRSRLHRLNEAGLINVTTAPEDLRINVYRLTTRGWLVSRSRS